MTTSSTTALAPQVGRCALCKIDLRGRFVYVDDEIESLLGRPREELFGRPIVDFLERESRQVVELILAERNHYESHFDYAELTLIGRDGRPLTVEATMSLCFHGGNPVNFQLILKPADVSTRSTDNPQPGLPVEQFIERYLAGELDGDMRSLATLLQEFTSAERVAAYLISDSGLEPRAGASRDSSGAFNFDSIPECTDLHHRIARSGGEYSITDEKAVQALRDVGAEVPFEFAATLSTPDGGANLLRFIFDDQTAEDILDGCVSRARLALRIIDRLSRRPPAPPESDEPDIDVKFTVGFLSSLGIGACLVDPTGAVVGYNPALTELLGDAELGPTSRDLIESLDPENKSGLADLISRCGADDDHGDVRVHFSLPSGTECLLVIIRLAEFDDDQSACWVVMPQPAAPRSSTVEGVPAWQSLIDGLKPVVDEVAAGAEDLSRDYCRQVGELDHTGLSRLHDAIRTLDEMHEYGAILQACSLPGDVAPVDLNDLVDNALEQIRKEYRDVVITCDRDDLPAIKSSHGRLTAVLRNLMSNCVRHNPEREVRIRIAAQISGRQCRITVSDSGVSVPPSEINRLFEFYLPPAPSGELRRSGGVGLGLSRELLRALGGTIKATVPRAGGARLAVTLPLTSKNRD